MHARTHVCMFASVRAWVRLLPKKVAQQWTLRIRDFDCATVHWCGI